MKTWGIPVRKKLVFVALISSFASITGGAAFGGIGLDVAKHQPDYCNSPTAEEARVPGSFRTKVTAGTRPFKYKFEVINNLCGRDSNFLHTFMQNRSSLTFNMKLDGVNVRYLPLRLSGGTRKSIRTKITSACHLNHKGELVGDTFEDGSREIWLSSYPYGIRSDTDWQDFLSIDKDGGVDYSNQRTDMFYLVREPFVYLDDIEALIKKFRCRSSETYGQCRDELIFAIDRLLDFELRLHIAKQSEVTSEQAKIDVELLESKLVELTDFQKLLHDKTKAVELGDKSPFGFVDALYGNSGLSFSVEQLDIGVNDAAYGLFQKIMEGSKDEFIPKKYRSAFVTSINNNTGKSCIASPIRLLGFPERAFLHRYTNGLNDTLKQNVEQIAENYKTWLKKQDEKFNKEFAEISIENKTLVIMLYHVGHWMGPKAEQKLKKVMMPLFQSKVDELKIACAIRKWLLSRTENVDAKTRYENRFFRTIDLNLSRVEMTNYCASN